MTDATQPILALSREELRQRALAFAEQQAELRAALELSALQVAEMKRVWREVGIDLEDPARMPATTRATREARLTAAILGMGRLLQPYTIQRADTEKGQWSETSWAPGIWLGK